MPKLCSWYLTSALVLLDTDRCCYSLVLLSHSYSLLALFISHSGLPFNRIVFNRNVFPERNQSVNYNHTLTFCIFSF